MPSSSLRSLAAFAQVSKVPPIWYGLVDKESWHAVAQIVHRQGGRLVALWGDPCTNDADSFVHAVFVCEHGILWIALQPQRAAFPSLTDWFPVAGRMERAIYDLCGLRAADNPDTRPWLRHKAWPADVFPLQADVPAGVRSLLGDNCYPFEKLGGEEIHEIPVGPVHAGTIEPGHFRFSCLGERVLRLEERLGYTHKGVERLFVDRDVAFGARLVGRVSGDSTVAYACAFAQAVEMILKVSVSRRTQILRAVMLERERILNHLGDIGAISNDAGLAFGLSQFLALKEDFLRDNARLFGHRYLMDTVVPGGVAVDIDGNASEALIAAGVRLRRDVARLEVILREHGGLVDRLVRTGRVRPQRAAALGVAGLAGRASGQAWDLRVQFPSAPYDRVSMRMALAGEGDVAARLALRFAEIYESLRLQEVFLRDLPVGAARVAVSAAAVSGAGLGIVEGWRGEILVALRLAEGRIKRCHPHDPSWMLWPALEEAVLQDIVADFPLINKSFNASYSGHDL